MGKRSLVHLLAGVLLIGSALPSEAATWHLKAPATSPTARAYAWTAFDAAHGNTVLFGGFDGTNNLNDTWLWDGSDWNLVHPATSPSARQSAGIAYDSTHHRVILFGGFDGTNYLSDTWGWDGSNWHQLDP